LTTELISLLEFTDSFLARTIIATLVIIPIVINILKSAYSFHWDFIRNFRLTKMHGHIEQINDKHVSHKFLKSCFTQEVVKLHTKLDVSHIEQEILLDWLENTPVTMPLIRSCWVNINFKNTTLVPYVSKLDIYFAWYSLISAFTLTILVVYLTLKIIHNILVSQVYGYLAIPLIGVGLIILMLRPVKLVFETKKLIYLLKQHKNHKPLSEENNAS